MTENRWKTGLFVLAALLVAGVTSAEGANATFVPGLSSTGATAASLDPGEYAVFSFPAINRPNTTGLDFRVHMSGEATGDYTWLELSPTGTEWLGFYGPPGDNFAAASSANATDALAMGWGFYAGDRVDFGVNWYWMWPGWDSITYLKITNLTVSGITLTIGAVEVAPFEIPPDQMIENLVDLVASYNLQQGIDNSLDAKLAAALDALNDVNANNDASAVNKLEAFISEVEAQRNKKITDAQATALITDAQAIIAALTAP